MLTLPIREIIPATPRTLTVRLDLDGSEFSYLAGQAVSVGAPGDPIRRTYSLAGAPEDAVRQGCLELLVGLLKDSGKCPLPIACGGRLDVDGPSGRFTFPADAFGHDLLFIAGGTGIAPIRSMLRHALTLTKRRVMLLYSARTPAEFAYKDELAALAAGRQIDLVLTVTSGEVNDWPGTRGRIGRHQIEMFTPEATTQCCVCGPVPFVVDIAKVLFELGVPRQHITIEEHVRRVIDSSERPIEQRERSLLA